MLAVVLPGCVTTIENDVFGRDRNYTAGLRFQRTWPAHHDEEPADDSWLHGATAAVANAIDVTDLHVPDDWTRLHTHAAVLGHSIFTPTDLEQEDVIEDDRPYAGWLYVGAIRYDVALDPDDAERRDVLLATELDLGVVGPASRAEQLQKSWHHLVNDEPPEGWDNQIHDEPAVLLKAVRQGRAAYWGSPEQGALSADAISHLGGALGNVLTGLECGGTLRAGVNLPRTFTLGAGERTSAQGTNSLSPHPWALYLFTGIDGRLVLYDIFLDGNTYRDSHDVDRRPLVGEGRYGLVVHVHEWIFGYTYVQRSREFEEQRSGHGFSSFTFGWTGRF